MREPSSKSVQPTVWIIGPSMELRLWHGYICIQLLKMEVAPFVILNSWTSLLLMIKCFSFIFKFCIVGALSLGFTCMNFSQYFMNKVGNQPINNNVKIHYIIRAKVHCISFACWNSWIHTLNYLSCRIPLFFSCKGQCTHKTHRTLQIY